MYAATHSNLPSDPHDASSEEAARNYHGARDQTIRSELILLSGGKIIKNYHRLIGIHTQMHIIGIFC